VVSAKIGRAALHFGSSHRDLLHLQATGVYGRGSIAAKSALFYILTIVGRTASVILNSRSTAVFAFILFCQTIHIASGQTLWAKTGSLNQPRLQTTGVLLNDGRILLAGSLTCTPRCTAFATAEIYNPATGVWSETSPLNSPRFNHVAAKLPDGRVLIAGGYVSPGVLTGSCEIYDPGTGVWAPTGSLSTPRQFHQGVVLANGNVLVVGGLGMDGKGSFVTLGSAELYDSATGQWKSAGSLVTARYLHTTTLLGDGRVLVTGGAAESSSGQNQPQFASAEIYDPASNGWTSAAPMSVTRSAHAATLLNTGQVLITGGWSPAGTPSFTGELYDAKKDQWTATARMRAPRANHTTTLLADASVLAVGGNGNWVVAERYDPATATWTAVPELNEGRTYHSATLLGDGSVLVAGGADVTDTYLSSAEVLRPSGERPPRLARFSGGVP
jgi:hypothetical protein